MLYINRSCIACDACRQVCPTQAIEVADPIYLIRNDACTLCKGYTPAPQCISACPMDAIVEADLPESKS